MSKRCSDPSHTEKYKDGSCKRCKYLRDKAFAQTPEGRLRQKLAQKKYVSTARGKQKHRDNARLYRKRHPSKVRESQWRAAGLPEPTRIRPRVCEICGGPPKGKPSLVLDHCHITGQFRGWLCSHCNLGIGRLGDTPGALQKALNYLIQNDPTAWLLS
jgi:Recombination endonuclease VII